ncbi:MAG: T9SS C-terminal target domain-containing protein [Candidatus Zixiibacteriota bacterium]|nr:MAG: T9SS C-terminal target domain-containing protein [candidate division Zixibacteria bacterium]
MAAKLTKAFFGGLFAAGILLGGAQAQVPDTLWTRTYGGNYNDKGNCVRQTADGGFIILGSSELVIGNWAAPLIRTDAAGNVQWQRDFDNVTVGEELQLTTDGGYVFTGYTTEAGAGGADVCLIKTDAAGNQAWFRTYGGPQWDVGAAVQQTSDGGYIIAGSTSSFGTGLGTYNVYLIKTDASGIAQWSRYFGGTAVEKGHALDQTSDGGYIITGRIQSEGAGGDDVYLIKTDASGNEAWHRTFGGAVSDIGYGVQQTSDGGYIVAGSTWSYGLAAEDAWLIKTDPAGNQTWAQTFGDVQWDCAHDVIQTADGGYAFTGYTIIPGDLWYEVYVVKTDPSGNEVWSMHHGLSQYDMGYSLQQTTDGGYIVAGKVGETAQHQENIYLIRLASESAALSVNLTPINPPLVIPVNGGVFSFNAAVQRVTGPQAPFIVWTRIKQPDGSYTPPALGPLTLNLPVGVTVARQRNQSVPGAWAPGTYEYLGYANTTFAYPAQDSSSFTFTKAADRNGGPWVTGASCTGDLFPGESQGSKTHLLPSDLTLKASPNPFNPETALRYRLPEPGNVSLRVYDTAGREVATLVDGWREAGGHEATFDGSGLASGVYLYTLTANGQTAGGKLMLLK